MNRPQPQTAAEPAPAPVPESAPAAPSSGVVMPPGWGVVRVEAAVDGAVDIEVALPPDGSITAACEECGAASRFPAEANGSIQKCPECEGYLDVGGLAWFEEAEAAGDADALLAVLPPHKPGCGCGPTGCGS